MFCTEVVENWGALSCLNLFIYFSNHLCSKTRNEQNAFLFLAASLSVFPSRIQFFRYESVTLICGEHGNSSEWRVVRNTSRHINEECAATRGKCFIDTVYQSDSGVYWCESGAGECSNAVNITVTGGFHKTIDRSQVCNGISDLAF